MELVGGKERGVLGVGIGACVREVMGLEDAEGLRVAPMVGPSR